MIGLPDYNDSIELFQNPDGSANARLGHKQFHSRRSTQEAMRFIESVFADETSSQNIYLIVGAGAGELLGVLNNHPHAGRILLYEPFRSLRQYLKNRLPQKTKFKYIKSEKELQAEMESLKKYKLNVILNPVYTRLKADIKHSLILDQTQDRFKRIYSHNFFEAIESDSLHFIQPSMENLNCTVLYCGAGPYLLEELSAIQTIYKNPPFTIASDSAAYPMIQAGYKVDLVVCVDSNPASQWHFARPVTKWPTILTWLPGPAFLKKYSNVIYYLSDYPLDQILARWVSDSGTPNTVMQLLSNKNKDVTGLIYEMAAVFKWKLITVGTGNYTKTGQSHVANSAYDYYARIQHNRLNQTSQYLYTLESKLHNLHANRSRPEAKKIASEKTQRPYQTRTIHMQDFRDYLFQHRFLSHLSTDDFNYLKNAIIWPRKKKSPL